VLTVCVRDTGLLAGFDDGGDAFDASRCFATTFVFIALGDAVSARVCSRFTLTGGEPVSVRFTLLDPRGEPVSVRFTLFARGEAVGVPAFAVAVATGVPLFAVTADVPSISFSFFVGVSAFADAVGVPAFANAVGVPVFADAFADDAANGVANDVVFDDGVATGVFEALNARFFATGVPAVAVDAVAAVAAFADAPASFADGVSDGVADGVAAGVFDALNAPSLRSLVSTRSGGKNGFSVFAVIAVVGGVLADPFFALADVCIALCRLTFFSFVALPFAVAFAHFFAPIAMLCRLTSFSFVFRFTSELARLSFLDAFKEVLLPAPFSSKRPSSTLLSSTSSTVGASSNVVASLPSVVDASSSNIVDASSSVVEYCDRDIDKLSLLLE
jgi:hypothetical protein